MMRSRALTLLGVVSSVPILALATLIAILPGTKMLHRRLGDRVTRSALRLTPTSLSHWRTGQNQHDGRRIGGMLLLLLLMALAGCSHAPASVVGATRTPTTVPTLAWQFVTLPNGAPVAGANGFAVSPVHGTIVWACLPGNGASYTIWQSHDAAASWMQIHVVAPVTPLPVTGCQVIADQSDVDALALVFTWGAGADGTLGSVSFYSDNGGAQWQQLTSGLQITEVATLGQMTYAILVATDPGLGYTGKVVSRGLVVSTDGLHSWQTINPPGVVVTNGASQFWIGATSADLMVSAPNTTEGGLLFQSTDAGEQWTALPLPAAQAGLASLAIWREQASGWFICSMSGVGSGFMQCTSNLGQSWTALPMLEITSSCTACDKGAAPAETSPCLPSAASVDGSLLATCPQTSGDADQMTFTLYRLPPGASKWVPLGQAPSSLIAYTRTGQLWCLTPGGTLAMLPQV
jgi:hypothetical protein